MSARYLRVVTLEPAGHESAVDAALRSACLPALLRTDAVVDAWIGRHGSRDLRTRLIASTWSEAPGHTSPDVAIVTGLGSNGATDVTISREQTLDLAVHERFDRPEPARILRLFRGRVRAGELDAYIADSRAGMIADALVNDGLVAFALGADPPDAFVTVSVWTGWSAIEQATGGNTRRPIATRHSVRLTGFDVVHFEVLPDLATRPTAAAAAAPVDAPRNAART